MSVQTVTPFTRKSTLVTPTLSDAVAAIATVDLRATDVEVGAVKETIGRIVSGGGVGVGVGVGIGVNIPFAGIVTAGTVVGHVFVAGWVSG